MTRRRSRAGAWESEPSASGWFAVLETGLRLGDAARAATARAELARLGVCVSVDPESPLRVARATPTITDDEVRP